MADRGPWPWIVTGALAAMICISLGFARLAIVHPDPLVVEDAYAAGLAWNERQQALARGDTAGWRLDLIATAEGDGLHIALAATDAAGEPLRSARLSARRVRPSEGGYDTDISLGADGTALVSLPRPGRWHIIAAAERDGAVLERVYRVER